MLFGPCIEAVFIAKCDASVPQFNLDIGVGQSPNPMLVKDIFQAIPTQS